jgi:hypothetical protein
MVAYEFYWRNDAGDEHLIGVLPERRKNKTRITTESIINWARKVLGNTTEIKDIFFVEVDV